MSKKPALTIEDQLEFMFKLQEEIEDKNEVKEVEFSRHPISQE
jgi:hypothetical protein